MRRISEDGNGPGSCTCSPNHQHPSLKKIKMLKLILHSCPVWFQTCRETFRRSGGNFFQVNSNYPRSTEHALLTATKPPFEPQKPNKHADKTTTGKVTSPEPWCLPPQTVRAADGVTENSPSRSSGVLLTSRPPCWPAVTEASSQPAEEEEGWGYRYSEPPRACHKEVPRISTAA